MEHFWRGHHLFSLSRVPPTSGGAKSQLPPRHDHRARIHGGSQLRLHFPGIPPYLGGDDMIGVESTCVRQASASSGT